ncbi:MAG: hypothetical protein ACWA40_10400 [Planktomarina sp.]
MPDLNKLTHRAMRSLVQSFGCYDAVAEVLNVRHGGSASKGTISKKMSGQLDWTLSDMIALQDAAGAYPVTHILVRQQEGQQETLIECLVAHAGVIAKEHGEATDAILKAAQTHCGDKRADAVTEIDQLIVALTEARSKLTAQTPSGVVAIKGTVS